MKSPLRPSIRACGRNDIPHTRPRLVYSQALFSLYPPRPTCEFTQGFPPGRPLKRSLSGFWEMWLRLWNPTSETKGRVRFGIAARYRSDSLYCVFCVSGLIPAQDVRVLALRYSRNRRTDRPSLSVPGVFCVGALACKGRVFESV